MSWVAVMAVKDGGRKMGMPQWSYGGPNGVRVRVRVRFDGSRTEVPANAKPKRKKISNVRV